MLEDMTGKRFGTKVLTGVHKQHVHCSGKTSLKWEYICSDCGTRGWAYIGNLRKSRPCKCAISRQSADKYTGLRIGSRTVSGKSKIKTYPNGGKCRIWEVVCDCGKIDWMSIGNIKTAKMCRTCNNKLTYVTHGHSKAPSGSAEHSTYGIWTGMRARCNNPKSKTYRNYGGRGIKVCARWNDSYEHFLEDMGLRPDGMQIDRIDNNKGYEPGNCRWVTNITNSRNTRKNVHITLDGETMCVAEWAERLGISRNTLCHRLSKCTTSPSVKDALTRPPRCDVTYLYDGLSLTMREWSDKTGIGRSTLYSRIVLRGWPIEKALTTPVKSHNKKEKKSDGD